MSYAIQFKVKNNELLNNMKRDKYINTKSFRTHLIPDKGVRKKSDRNKFDSVEKFFLGEEVSIRKIARTRIRFCSNDVHFT